MEWYQVKVAISTAMGVSQDALHVMAGVGLQVAMAVLFRRRLAHMLPWIVVLAAAAGNEWSDLNLELWPDRAVQIGESLKDMVVTMVLPTVLLLLSRYAPRLFVEATAGIAGPAMAKPLETGADAGARDRP